MKPTKPLSVHDPDGYALFHDRMRRSRGKASAHSCAAMDCPRVADHWAWQHTGPSRSGVYKGVPVTWGSDPTTYVPMCRSHHTMIDRGGTLTHCPNGHARSVFGAAKTGNCKRCARERQNASRRSRRANDPEYRERMNVKTRERARIRRSKEKSA